ncbi:MAG: ABC transporter ATP-binding protein [Deltaproteobacteria bacterium]|nr:ABC transporter ATP-binding protein [Deltaproteobacteria bacterium]
MSGLNADSNANQSDICLELKDVVKQFPGVTAVDHISLEIEEGEIFSFLGPSGCGKSTLLRIVAGLENQDQGDVLIGGKLVNDLPPYKRDCSTVFQSHALFPHMTVFDNIGFGLVERKIPKPEIKQRVQNKINLVNLGGMEDRFPHQLSGGQMQRVALARSLVLEPTVLLLDEPLAALDRKLRKEMQVELKRIQREVGTTFLNVTHDQKEALSLSDRIAVMKKGKLLQIGTPDEIYETPHTRFVASFMGASNIFSGRVVGARDGMLTFKSDVGLQVALPESNDIPADQITGFSVHPELIDLSPEGADTPAACSATDVSLPGTIKEVFYLGDFSEMSVKIDDADINLTVYMTRGWSGPKMKMAEGQRVVALWSAASMNLLVD